MGEGRPEKEGGAPEGDARASPEGVELGLSDDHDVRGGL